MRILLVSEMIPYLPSHDGFRLIPANLIRNLFDRHEVHLVALSYGDEAEQSEWSRAYCKSVSIFRTDHGGRARFRAQTGAADPALSRFVADAVVKARPDLIHLEGGGLAALLRSTARGRPGVLCVHDSRALRFREFAEYSTGIKARVRLRVLSLFARRQERRWFRYADRVVVTSPSDAQFVLSGGLNADRIAVIPNGVDLEYFAYRPAPEAGRIVFTGNMSWPPNEDAAEHFARDIMPTIRSRVPDASFWIVGAGPSARVQNLSSIDGVHVTGTVADIRPWIWSAAVYASPLRFGLGVKNKILEAMACGVPIVATSRSLSGTPLIDGRHAMIADDDAKFIESVVRLLSDVALRESLSREARHKVEAENSWASVAMQYESVYREALARQPRSSNDR